MKKNDSRILILLLLVAGGGFLLFNLLNHTTAQKQVRISQNSHVIATWPLSENRVESLSFDGGFNKIVIENGYAFVESADCSNQVCVHSKPISEPGETIACLPHKLILEIIQE